MADSKAKADQPIVLEMYTGPTVDKEGKSIGRLASAGCMCECGSKSGAGGGQARV